VIVLLSIFVVLAALLTLIWWSQERILFQPPRSYGVVPETDRVDYTASDGQHLVGYLVGKTASTERLLLCFHGNADLAMWQLDWARSVTEQTGAALMLAEYRGYMSLDGHPSYMAAKLDALAAYDYVHTHLHIPDDRLAFFGHSLGSAIAAELAEIHHPRALLLQSPFTSAFAMAKGILTTPVAMFWKVVSRIHFDTARIVATLDVPVAVAHGRRDRVVPFRMGVEVYNSAKIKGPLLVVAGAGHNDLPEIAGERYWGWMAEALNANLTPPQQSEGPG
jgi:fermentation-respiration switch protein FrsA (DUF1100 family)